MTERPNIVLPPLAGRQLASWRALLELAPHLGLHWTLVGGQTRSERAKHVRDTDALAVLVGPGDRASERLTSRERSVLRAAATDLELRPLARRSLELLSHA